MYLQIKVFITDISFLESVPITFEVVLFVEDLQLRNKAFNTLIGYIFCI